MNKEQAEMPTISHLTTSIWDNFESYEGTDTCQKFRFKE